LIGWVDSEESMIQFSGPIFNYQITYRQLDTYINAKNRFVYKVINSESLEVVGHAELNNIDYINRSAKNLPYFSRREGV